MRKLVQRPRRLRQSAGRRNLVRETKLSAHDFVLPLFVGERATARKPIASMRGVFQFALPEVADESQRAYDLALQSVLVFGYSDESTSVLENRPPFITSAVSSRSRRLVSKRDFLRSARPSSRS